MPKLEDIKPGLLLAGVIPGQNVSVIAAQAHGADAIELTFRRVSRSTGRSAGRWLRAGVLGLSAMLATAAPAGAADELPGRASADRPDELRGAQVHFVYALPSDGADRQLDVNGTIANSVTSMQAWLRGQAAGRDLRVDTAGSAPDVTFVRLSKRDDEIAPLAFEANTAMSTMLQGVGLNDPAKLYAVYYDGGNIQTCGSGGYRPTVTVFLRARQSGYECDSDPFAGPGEPPRFKEFTMLHEIMHGVGMVPSCAPHGTPGEHVGDDRRDLMYGGVPDSNWDSANMALDVGRDDYLDANVPGCRDLSRSAFFDGGGTEMPPNWWYRPADDEPSRPAQRLIQRVSLNVRGRVLVLRGTPAGPRRRAHVRMFDRDNHRLRTVSVTLPGTRRVRLARGTTRVTVRAPATASYRSLSRSLRLVRAVR